MTRDQHVVSSPTGANDRHTGLKRKQSGFQEDVLLSVTITLKSHVSGRSDDDRGNESPWPSNAGEYPLYILCATLFVWQAHEPSAHRWESRAQQSQPDGNVISKDALSEQLKSTNQRFSAPVIRATGIWFESADCQS
jgi:hypothetical protein